MQQRCHIDWTEKTEVGLRGNPESAGSRLLDITLFSMEKTLADKFTHFDEKGRAVMVDVGEKDITVREATAGGEILMEPKTLDLILEGRAKKGDVLGTARLAGIMAAKKTPDLIPLTHPLPLNSVKLDFVPDKGKSLIQIQARVRVTARTGVEMEALTAVAVAGLTVYDMCKAVDRTMVLSNIRLLEKSGGRSGLFRREEGA